MNRCPRCKRPLEDGACPPCDEERSFPAGPCERNGCSLPEGHLAPCLVVRVVAGYVEAEVIDS